jgi:hypothetical protein
VAVKYLQDTQCRPRLLKKDTTVFNMYHHWQYLQFFSLLIFIFVKALLVYSDNVDCPGYVTVPSSVTTTDTGLTARLNLAGPACNSYGIDLEELLLTVEYQSGIESAFAHSFCFAISSD